VTQHQAARWLGGWHFQAVGGQSHMKKQELQSECSNLKWGDSESHGFQYQTRQMTWLIWGTPIFGNLHDS